MNKEEIKKYIKEFGCFLGVIAYIVGVLGGIGYACYSKAYFIAICIGVLAVEAAPVAYKLLKTMMSEE